MRNTEEFKRVLNAKPNCILGKNGITLEFLSHIRQLLKNYKIIKIKVLKAIVTRNNMRDLANRISNETNSHILDIRGKTIIISK